MQKHDLPRTPWTCRWGLPTGPGSARPAALRHATWACQHEPLWAASPDTRPRDCQACPAWETVAPAARPERMMVAVQRLSARDWRQLAPSATISVHDKGDRLLCEGTPAARCLFLTAGRARVVKLAPNGREVLIEIAEAGDPVGPLAGFDGGAAPLSAVALERTECVTLPHQDLMAVTASASWLALGLLHGLTLKLMSLMDRTAELTAGRVEERFARMFLRLATEAPQTDGAAIPYVSRQDLAALTGTTVETCIRLMTAWDRQNLVRTRPEGFLILDRAALEALSERSR